jgi:hypothetical protein
MGRVLDFGLGISDWGFLAMAGDYLIFADSAHFANSAGTPRADWGFLAMADDYLIFADSAHFANSAGTPSRNPQSPIPIPQ